jgi:uncharacterized protein YdaU (DUF1376 family)
MAKDPAFLFYASDFLTGVSDLSMEERGVYITLLCLQHQKGRLTEKMIKLCGGIATADVLAKFTQDENGSFYNKRLEEEIHKRKQHSEKQKLRALDGWKKRKANESHGNATAMPLENANENVNTNDNSKYIVSIITCKEFALNDPQWVERNNPTSQELQEFMDLLTDRGETQKTPIDFKSHFSNWKKKKPQPKAEIKPSKHLDLDKK